MRESGSAPTDPRRHGDSVAESGFGPGTCGPQADTIDSNAGSMGAHAFVLPVGWSLPCVRRGFKVSNGRFGEIRHAAEQWQRAFVFLMSGTGGVQKDTGAFGRKTQVNSVVHVQGILYLLFEDKNKTIHIIIRECG
jgi:hypothetical protein